MNKGSTLVETDEEEKREPDGNTPPPLAKRAENDGRPVLWAFVVLLAAAIVVTGFSWAGRLLPGQIEIFSNIAMLAVAARGFFALGQPSVLSGRRLSSVLGNLTVSVLAFFMNINVFRHTIPWNRLPDDLWGGHIGWAICAAVQVLFLSGFVQCVCRQALRFLTAAAREGKNAASALRNAVRLSDKGVLLIFLTGGALWGVYLVSQILGRGVQAAFSDANILWGSVLLLLVWAIAGVLLYMFPAICKKSKWTVFGMDGKKIVIAAGIAAGVLAAVLIFALLAMLRGAGVVLTVLAALAVLAGLICAVVRYSVKKIIGQGCPEEGDLNDGGPAEENLNGSDPDPSTPRQNTPNRSRPVVCRKPNWKDVLLTALAYIVIPLVLICVMVASSDELRRLLSSGDCTWQRFMDAVGRLLQNAKS